MQETHVGAYSELDTTDSSFQDTNQSTDILSDFYHMSVVTPKAEKPTLHDMSKALTHEQKAIKAIGGKALGMHYILEDLREAVVVWYFEGKVPEIEPNDDAREVFRNGEVKGYTLRVFEDLLEADRFRRTSNGNYLKELEHLHAGKDGIKKKAFVFLV